MRAHVESWTPELRRAVMSACPAFFGWTAEQQLRYRVKLPDDDREAIVAALLREHGERRPAALSKLESHGRVPLQLQHRINEWLQPLIGIGADAFALNESFGEGRSILDFDTLLDYDRDDHAFQQDANLCEIDGYVPEPYIGGLHGTWARVLIDGRLCYLTLSMASWHLYGTMRDAASSEIEARVPHRHVRGPDDGKRDERGMIRWDMRTARSITSGEYFGDFLILAPFSIEGASSKPGAVQAVCHAFRDLRLRKPGFLSGLECARRSPHPRPAGVYLRILP